MHVRPENQSLSEPLQLNEGDREQTPSSNWRNTVSLLSKICFQSWRQWFCLNHDKLVVRASKLHAIPLTANTKVPKSSTVSHITVAHTNCCRNDQQGQWKVNRPTKETCKQYEGEVITLTFSTEYRCGIENPSQRPQQKCKRYMHMSQLETNTASPVLPSASASARISTWPCFANSKLDFSRVQVVASPVQRDTASELLPSERSA